MFKFKGKRYHFCTLLYFHVWNRSSTRCQRELSRFIVGTLYLYRHLSVHSRPLSYHAFVYLFSIECKYWTYWFFLHWKVSHSLSTNASIFHTGVSRVLYCTLKTMHFNFISCFLDLPKIVRVWRILVLKQTGMKCNTRLI